MRPIFSCARAAVVASVLLPLASACTHYPLPASPVAAPMTDMEAARAADDFIAPRVGTGKTLTEIRPWKDGWLVKYATDVYPGARPPKESHLIVVNNNGAVHEMEFRKD